MMSASNAKQEEKMEHILRLIMKVERKRENTSPRKSK